jgi:hypothetical protein
MFRIMRRTAAAAALPRKSMADEFARLTTAGASSADALRILFDMVTTNGPVPEIDTGKGGAG